MKSLPAVILLALTSACIVPCSHTHGDRPAQAMVQAASAPAPVLAAPEAHEDHAPGGLDCAICAGLNAGAPGPTTTSDTPGGHGPPPGHGAAAPGPPSAGAGPR